MYRTLQDEHDSDRFARLARFAREHGQAIREAQDAGRTLVPCPACGGSGDDCEDCYGTGTAVCVGCSGVADASVSTPEGDALCQNCANDPELRD